MEYRRLGRLALKVSPLCLGTMNFGPDTNEADSHAIMDLALERGINFFDTADIYGDEETFGGDTEEIIGRWFAKGGGRRERVVLSTKVMFETGPGPNDKGLSALHIRQACEDSLRRLQTDHIDVYQMHMVDREAPWEEVLQAMDLLVQQGKVLYVGSSNFAGWDIARANEIARRRDSLGLVSEQCRYSLSQRLAELEVLPACRAYGMGVVPWSPLDGGLLAGMLAGVEGGRRMEKLDRLEAYRPQLERYEALCAELGEPPAAVGLAWVMSNPLVTAPIVGPRLARHLEGALRATELTLSAEVLAQLDDIFPGPGEAPAAFFDEEDE
jgi:aryl-alcohol dehydrogenase-like predicted oxidoreductase